MLEFALVLPMLLLLICGMMDFGFAFSNRLAVTNGARDGVRFATTHPTAWTNAASPALNTIEGQVRNAGGTASIPNDDSHILINYLTASGTICGNYSASSNAFVGQNGGTQANCVVPGNFIQVQVTYHYNLITPIVRQLFPTGVDLVSSSTMVEEQ